MSTTSIPAAQGRGESVCRVTLGLMHLGQTTRAARIVEIA